MNRKIVLAAALLVAAPALVQYLGAGPAQAATIPTAVVTSALTPFDSTAAKTIAAQCPAGHRVIGGGVRVSGAEHVFVTREVPVTTAAGDSYEVTAVEDQVGYAGTWALQAYAICAQNPPGWQIVTATGAPGSGFFQGITASCPAGKFAVGAGGEVMGGQGGVALVTHAEGGIFSSRSTAGGLEDLSGFGGTWHVVSHVVCVTPASLSDLRLVRVQSPTDGSDRKVITATCPAGMRVTGGTGWADMPGVVESVNVDAARTRIQVIARENDTSGGFQWGAIAVALCAR